jgi:FtsH-binding integral membrane protein
MNNQPKDVTPAATSGLTAFFQRTYLYMTAALFVTAFTSWILANVFPTQTMRLVGSLGIIGAIVLIGLQLLIVMMIQKATMQNPARAFGLLLAFSVFNGVTLSMIFMMFTAQSLATTFLSTAAMFGGMAAYGMVTKRDLAGFRPILFGTLIGLIVSGLLNAIFFHSSTLVIITSFIGVILFAAFTAYDNNRLKRTYMMLEDRGIDATGLAVSGALSLYLDFINLFTSLLQFMGVSRD